MFCGCAGHLDEFYIHQKRIEKRHFEYAINSYHDEFFEFSSCSYSHLSSRISSYALPQFSHGRNHRSYGFGSRENHFVPRHFGYCPRPHRGNRFSYRSGFLLELLTLTLSPNTWTVHIFPIVVHVPLDQMVRC
jgi:hypothetical protein